MNKPTGELSFSTVGVVLHGMPGDATTIDLSEITRADSAGLALLLELTRRARKHGRDFKIINANPQVRSLAAFFGVDAALEFSA